MRERSPLFSYCDSISMTKQDLMGTELRESEYCAYQTNRWLSFFPDTVMAANLMNSAPHVSERMQYDFYLGSVRKRKRFSKWPKRVENREAEIVGEYYGFGPSKAEETLRILTRDQIDDIVNRMKPVIEARESKKTSG